MQPKIKKIKASPSDAYQHHQSSIINHQSIFDGVQK